MEFIPTNLPIENEYPKLVRDRIPEILQTKGLHPETLVLNNEQYLNYLLKKVVEEAVELQAGLKNGNMQEELADVYEVLKAILATKGWTRREIIKIQKIKREKNGGFAKKLLMLKRPVN